MHSAMHTHSGHRHEEVRARLVAGSSHWAALARCTGASHIQAQRHDVQLSRWSGATVLARLLPTSLWCHVTASSPICWSATAERTAPEAEYICPASFLCGWSVGVELVAGLPERPGRQQRHFLQAPKDVLFAAYWYTFSALEVLRRTWWSGPGGIEAYPQDY